MLLQKYKKIYANKLFVTLALVFVISVFGILAPQGVAAGIGDQVMAVVSKIFLQFAQWLGQLLIMIVSLMSKVAQYDNFENENFVINAWTMVRDVANMFFILVLLIIAVATILRIEQYSAKRLLFKLLLMALLINFSKSIIGFIIDIAQAVMMFFVNSFKDGVEALVLVKMLKIDTLLNVTTMTGLDTALELKSLLGAIAMIILMLIIAMVVVGVVTVVFLFRVIFLWILIIFSPIVFLLHAVPAGARYAGQWWGSFSKYVITGPVLAFFLWLAFSAIQAGPGGQGIDPAEFKIAGAGGTGGTGTGLTSSVSEFFQESNFFGFLIGIALLIGALMATSQLGVAGGALASKTVGKLQQYGTASAKGAGRFGLAVGRSRWGLGMVARAEAVGARIKHRAEAMPMVRLATRAGREQAGLETRERIYGGRFGGEVGKAKAEAYRGKLEDAVEQRMRERGQLRDARSRRMAWKTARTQIERHVALKSRVENDDPSTLADIAKTHPLPLTREQWAEMRKDPKNKKWKSPKVQQALKYRHDISHLMEQKKSWYVEETKVDREGMYHVRDEENFLARVGRRIPSVRGFQLKKELKAAKERSRSFEEDPYLGYQYLALQPSNREFRNDHSNMIDATTGIANYIKTLEDLDKDKKLEPKYQALIPQLRSQYTEFVTSYFNANPRSEEERPQDIYERVLEPPQKRKARERVVSEEDVGTRVTKNLYEQVNNLRTFKTDTDDRLTDKVDARKKASFQADENTLNHFIRDMKLAIESIRADYGGEQNPQVEGELKKVEASVDSLSVDNLEGRAYGDVDGIIDDIDKRVDELKGSLPEKEVSAEGRERISAAPEVKADVKNNTEIQQDINKINQITGERGFLSYTDRYLLIRDLIRKLNAHFAGSDRRLKAKLGEFGERIKNLDEKMPTFSKPPEELGPDKKLSDIEIRAINEELEGAGMTEADIRNTIDELKTEE